MNRKSSARRFSKLFGERLRRLAPRKSRRQRGAQVRLAIERLEARCLLAIDPFPYVASLDRGFPVNPTTDADAVTYSLAFSEPVTGVDPSDFQVERTGTVNSTQIQVNGSGASYTVSIIGITGDGTLGLRLVDNGSIRDATNNGLMTQNTTVAFQAKQDFATGSSPYSVALSDVNRDGKPDLAAANSAGNTVSVLLGNGNGTFGTGRDASTAASPYWADAGDANRDGKQDLVVINNGASSTSVLLGNGDGTFQPKRDFATGPGPNAAALHDMDGDGDLDIVVANSLNDTLSLLLGNGDGTFLAKQDFATDRGPFGVAVGDLNGDGRSDVVSANINASTVSVLLGDGAGAFPDKQNFTTGSGPVSVAMGDFNGDGKIDLATANRLGGSVSVLLGNGDGTFQTKRDVSTGSGAFSIGVRDLNGDGKLDLAVALRNINTVSVLLGAGDGTFPTKLDFAAGREARFVAIGDVNGDGKPDLTTANTADNSVSVLLNGRSGSFTGQVYTIFSATDAVDDSFELNEDSEGRPLDVLANDEPAGRVGSLVIVDVTQPGHGTVAIVEGGAGVTYRPDANYAGEDRFTYAARDTQGGSDTATVTVTVREINDAPAAIDDAATVNRNSRNNLIDVLANDGSMPDLGEVLAIASIGQGDHGVVSLGTSGLSLLYTPQADFIGRDHFSYTIHDGRGGQATATVSVTIVDDSAGSNTPPSVAISVSDPLPKTHETLTVTAVANDVDQDPVTLTYIWRVDGTVIRSVTTANLTDSLELAAAYRAGTGETVPTGTADAIHPDTGSIVEVTVTPNDGLQNGSPASVWARLIQIDLINGVLHIEGTNASDHIKVRPGAAEATLEVAIGDGELEVPAGLFPVSSVSTIQVEALDGDDIVDVSSSHGVRARILGGRGDDQLSGGSADDVLIGGPGDDLLIGHGGSDSLYGGEGANTLHGDGVGTPLSGEHLVGVPGPDFLSQAPGTFSESVDSGDTDIERMPFEERAFFDLLHRFRDAFGLIVSEGAESVYDEGIGRNVSRVTGRDNERGDSVQITGLATVTAALRGDDEAAQHLLAALRDQPFANEEGETRLIRHPLVHDFVRRGERYMADRLSPLTKDGIVGVAAALDYVYRSPGMNDESKELARQVMEKYLDFLNNHHWRTLDPYPDHYRDSKPKSSDPKKHVFANVFGNERGGEVDSKGEEGYAVLGPDRFALRDTAQDMGFIVGPWSVTAGIGAAAVKLLGDEYGEFVRTISDNVANFIGEKLDLWLQEIDIDHSYSFEVIEGVGWTRIGPIHLGVRLSTPDRENIVRVTTDVIREYLRFQLAESLDSATDIPAEVFQLYDQIVQFADLVVDRLPNWTGRDQWKPLIASTLKQAMPWMTGEVVAELIAFHAYHLLAKGNPLSDNAKADLAHLSFWPTLVAFEARPDLVTLLGWSVNDLDGFLNGPLYDYEDERTDADDRSDFHQADLYRMDMMLYDWLADGDDQVDWWLDKFQTDPRFSNIRYGWKVAHEELVGDVESAVDSWHKDNGYHKLDFLVLQALHDHGRPVGIPAMADGWLGHWEDVLEDVGAQAKRVWDNLRSDLGAFAKRLYQEFQPALTDLAKALWKPANKNVGTLGNALWGNVVAKSAGNLGALAQALANAGGSFDSGKLGDIAKALWGKADKNVTKLADALWGNAIDRKASNLGALAKALANAGGTFDSGKLGDIAKALWGKADKNVTKLADALWGNAIDKKASNLGVLAKALANAGGRFDSGKLGDIAKALWGKADKKLTKLADALWGNAVDKKTSNLGALAKALANAGGTFDSGKLGDIAKALWGKADKSVTKLADALWGNAVNKTTSNLGALAKALANAGGTFDSGKLGDIAKALWGKADQNVTKLADALWGNAVNKKTSNLGALAKALANAGGTFDSGKLGDIAKALWAKADRSVSTLADALWGNAISKNTSNLGALAKALANAGGSFDSGKLGDIAKALWAKADRNARKLADALWNSGVMNGSHPVDLAKLLVKAGARAGDIADAFVNKLRFGWRDVAESLWRSGAMKGKNSLDLAKALVAAGARAEDIVDAFVNRLEFGWRNVASGLWNSGAMAGKYPLDLAGILVRYGAQAGDIADAFRHRLEFGWATIAAALWESGAMAGKYVADLAEVLVDTGAGAQSLVSALRDGIRAGAGDLIAALRRAFGWSYREAASYIGQSVSSGGSVGGFVGQIINGYQQASVVFFDANLNGFLDDDEPWSFTGSDGGIQVEVAAVFDRNGNGELDDDEGQWIAEAGVDTSTSLESVLRLVAPASSHVITPLTNLASRVAARNLMSFSEGASQILRTLGLPPVDVRIFDPISQTLAGNEDGPRIFAAHAQIQDTLAQFLAVLGAANPETSGAVLAAGVVDVFADHLLGEDFDLTHARVIERLLMAAVENAGDPLDASLPAGIAEIIAAANRVIAAIPPEANFNYLDHVARAKLVAQGEVASDLARVTTGALDVATAISVDTGAALERRVNEAIVPPVLTVPLDILAEATHPTGTVVEFDVFAYDLAGRPLPVAISAASGEEFPLGETIVHASTTNSAGNVSNAEFRVTVRDNTAPDLRVADIEVEATGPDGAVVTYPAPSVSDHVDLDPSVTWTIPPGSFPLGETSVAATAHDEAGHASTEIFTVRVMDTTPPDIAFPAGILVEADTENGAWVTLPAVTATDLVDPAPLVTLSESSGFFPIGSTRVIVTANDAAGNLRDGEFLITVVDTTPPRITVPEGMVLEAEFQGGIQLAAELVETSDVGDAAPVVSFSQPMASLGATSVTVTATDASGNKSSTTLSITVVDTTPPTFVEPVDLVVPANVPEGAMVRFPAFIATDAVDPQPVITFDVPAGLFPVGETWVTATATDASGNQSEVSFLVTVTPGVDDAAILASISHVSERRQEGGTISVRGQAFHRDAPVAAAGTEFVWRVYKNGSDDPWVVSSGIDQVDFQFTPDDNGSHRVELTVKGPDGQSNSVAALVAVENSPPEVTMFSQVVAGNGLTRIDLLVAAEDPSVADQSAGLSFAWTITRDGVLILEEADDSGQFQFVPDDAGAYSIAVVAADKDGDGTSIETIVSLAPVASNSEFYGVQDVPITGQLRAASERIAALRYEAVTPPSHGSVLILEGGDFEYTPEVGFHGDDEFSFVAADGSFASNVAQISLILAPRIERPWQNSFDALDVDQDSFVAPIDVLLIINELNFPMYSGPEGQLSVIRDPEVTSLPSLDVNGDSYVTPIDALEIINYLNKQGEGEESVARSPVFPETHPIPAVRKSGFSRFAHSSHPNSESGVASRDARLGVARADSSAIHPASRRPLRPRWSAEPDIDHNLEELLDLIAGDIAGTPRTGSETSS